MLHAHRRFRQRAGTALVVVVKRVWEREVHIRKQIRILRRRGPFAMRRLGLRHQAEGLARIAVLQPLDGNVADQVADVSLQLVRLAVLDHHRVHIEPLPWQYVPVIETRRIGKQMPLADHRRLIPRLLEILREVRLLAIERIEDRHTVLVAVLAGKNRRAAGRANRVVHEAAREEHAVLRDAIDARRLIDATAVGAHGMRRVVVRHDEEDVRLARR